MKESVARPEPGLSPPSQGSDRCHSAAHDSGQSVTLPLELTLAKEALRSLFGHLGQKQLRAEADSGPQLTRVLDFGLVGHLGRLGPFFGPQLPECKEKG